MSEMREESENIGKNIKELRKSKGLTQADLAELLGVNKSAVQRYESGVIVNLKTETIRKLCDIFDTYPYKFFYTKKELNLKSHLQLLDNFCNLSIEHQEQLLKTSYDLLELEKLREQQKKKYGIKN